MLFSLLFRCFSSYWLWRDDKVCFASISGIVVSRLCHTYGEFSRLHAYFLGLKIRPMHSEHFSLLGNIFPPHMNVPANTIHHSSKSATAKKQSSFSSPSLSLPVFIKFNNGTSLSLLPSLLSLALPSSPSQSKLIPTSVIQPNPGAREEVL